MLILKKKYMYVAGSFLAGFSVMVVELVSGRIVAPIIGSSVFTWTSVIGTTLLGLALGSYLGGKIADNTTTDKSLPLSFLTSSVLVALIPILSIHTDFIVNSYDSILILNLFMSLYLFLFPALAIGAIQPIILKKYALDFSKIGSEYGILSSVWSTGGIIGVFLTGFFFISTIGSRETIWLMAIILFLTGLIFATRDKKIIACFIFVLFFFLIIFFSFGIKEPNPNILFQKETNYYDAKVIKGYLPQYGETKFLVLDADFHSIEYPTKAEYYPEMYPVFGNLKEDIKNIMIIGSGAYTMPKKFKDYYKDSSVSVVEIDPEMINISNDFFNLKKYDIKTIIGDAKIALDKKGGKYDVIFGDAYNSFISVPWYLITKEWNDSIKNRLNDNGIYAINFISALQGEKSFLFKSILKTFKISFPDFYVFTFREDKKNTQNIVILGIKDGKHEDKKLLKEKLKVGENSFLANKLILDENLGEDDGTILTDNFSPVEKLMNPAVKSYLPKNLFELREILSSK